MNEEEMRTIPWSTYEYVKVNGICCVYEWSEDNEMVVKFPGGKSVSLPLLINKYKVVLPEVKRDFRFAEASYQR
jgi:hypothetical protein